jgi:heat shock protein HtpX
MAFAKRMFFFFLTNALVMVSISLFLNFVLPMFGIRLDPSSLLGLLAMCFVWGFAGSIISLLMSKTMVKMSMGVKVIDPVNSSGQERSLLNMVYRISERAGLPKMPEVGIYESQDINAFATGRSRSSSLVAVSTGLLTRMNENEVEGVIGHEIAHVANGDMVTMTLIQGVVNSFAMFFSRIVSRIVASSFDEKSRYMVQMVLTIVLDIAFSVLGSFVVAYFSRIREFRADAGGAKYAGREKMIAGLQKLRATFDQLEPDTTSSATLKISSRPAGIMALMSTHPPLEERIRRLQAGI